MCEMVQYFRDTVTALHTQSMVVTQSADSVTHQLTQLESQL